MAYPSEPVYLSSKPVTDPQELDTLYRLLFYQLLRPLHPQQLQRQWRRSLQLLDTTEDTLILPHAEQQGWIARARAPVPDTLSTDITPDILQLTPAGLDVAQSLYPCDFSGETADSPPERLAVWAEWAVGHTLEVGSAVPGTPFRYEVRWLIRQYASLDWLKPNGYFTDPTYWVHFWPRQGRARPLVLVWNCSTWGEDEIRYYGLTLEQAFGEETLSRGPAPHVDALYWVALTPAVATPLQACLETYLTQTPAPKPRPDVAVFTLEALIEHWLPAPHQLRRWQGKPPVQCRAARPVYFRQGG